MEATVFSFDRRYALQPLLCKPRGDGVRDTPKLCSAAAFPSGDARQPARVGLHGRNANGGQRAFCGRQDDQIVVFRDQA
jgi:hypothetical protein